MSGVFVSYAREDGPWVRGLVEELERAGEDTWVDWGRIPETAAWWPEILRAIDSATAFVFVISATSAASETCAEEIRHAADRGKRILPVMLERVDAPTLHEDIAALQWIATDGASVSDVAARIIAAYHTDLEWLREQARLTVRVAEWESKARAAAFELRGEDLEQSEQWLARADSRDGRNAPPALTTYVIASRHGATRRTERALLVALAALLVMTVLGTVAYLQYLRSERERRGAVAERLAAESVRARLERRPQRALLLAVAAVRTRTDRGEIAAVEALDALYTASTNLGGAPIGAIGTSIEALSLFPDGDACISGSDDGILRIWSTARAGPSLFAVDAHKGGVTLVTTGRNGSLVVSAGHDRSVRIWKRDRNALRQIAKYDHPARIRVARLSPDGQTLVSESWGGQIAVHDLDADGSIRKTESLLVADAMDAALEPEGRWLAAIDGQGAVTVIDRRAVPHTRLVVAKHSSAGVALAFSRDGRWLASSGLGHDVVLTDMTNPGGPEASRTLKGHDGSVFSLAFREDGRWLATASDDGTARLWAIGTSASSAEIVLVGHTDAVREIAFLPGPALSVVTASNDRTARLWTADAADPSATKSVVLRGHDDVVTTIAIDTKKPRIVTGGRDGTMRAWDPADRDPGRSIIPTLHRAHKDEVRAFALSHDEKRGVSIDLSGTACAWTFEPVAARCRAAPVPAGDRLGVVPCPDRDAFVVRQRRGKLLVCSIQDSPCEVLSAGDANVMAAACGTSRIAAADAKGHVYFWEWSGSTATRHELTPHHPGLPLALQLSSDERFLASADQKGSVIVWRLPGTEGEMLTGHTDGVTVLSFAQDSTRFVSAGFDATALEWDLTSTPPGRIATLVGHTQSTTAPLGITSARFDPSGRFVATSGVDATVRLWPIRYGVAGAEPIVLSGHEQATFGHGVESLDVADRWLASGGEDGLVRLWDVAGDSPALAGAGLSGHTKAVRSVRFIAKGAELVTASEDSTVRVWPIATELLLRAACGEAGRDFTTDERIRYFGSADAAGVCDTFR